jgi:hypothetical protein
MTTLQIQTPLDFGEVEVVGPRRILKQILPIGTVFHQGRALHFTPEKLMAAAKNFKQRVFDQVPANLATPDNCHNEDPRLNAGRVVDLVFRTGKGLYAVIETNRVGAEVFKNNPLIGASVRWYENFVRDHDKKQFGPVVRHVCLTQDPHITGMEPAVMLGRLFGAEPRVVDLTRATFAKGADMTDEQIAKDAAHPATRAMVAGLDRMSPAARTAWLAALHKEMGAEGARRTVATIRAAKQQVAASGAPQGRRIVASHPSLPVTPPRIPRHAPVDPAYAAVLKQSGVQREADSSFNPTQRFGTGVHGGRV